MAELSLGPVGGLATVWNEDLFLWPVCSTGDAGFCTDPWKKKGAKLLCKVLLTHNKASLFPQWNLGSRRNGKHRAHCSAYSNVLAVF